MSCWYVDQIQDDALCAAFSTRIYGEGRTQNFSQKTLARCISVDVRDMMMCLKEIGEESVDCLCLAEDRELV